MCICVWRTLSLLPRPGYTHYIPYYSLLLCIREAIANDHDSLIFQRESTTGWKGAKTSGFANKLETQTCSGSPTKSRTPRRLLFNEILMDYPYAELY